MSFGGMLATAVAGSAGVVGKQAGDDIDAQRKTELMKQQAEIEEQSRMRLAEFQERQRRGGVLWETSGEGGAAKREYRKGELLDSSEADIAKARGMIPVQQESAAATAKTADDITKKRAGDKSYLSAIRTIDLAHPEVQAHLAQMAASAGASAAQTRLLGENLRQLQSLGTMTDQIRGLQTRLAAAKTDDERSTLQEQITSLGFTGKDTKGFMSIAERAMTNGDSALKVLNDPLAAPDAKEAALTQLKRANEFAEKAAAQAGIKIGSTAPTDRFAIPGAKGGKGADPYAKPKSGSAAGAAADPAKTVANAPAKYGLLSSPRVGYLEGLSKAGTINASEKQELDELIATKSTAWFRGRASEQD